MFGGGSRLKCDSCGRVAPDVVGPILYGIERWREFSLDGEREGRRYEATVLLCGNRFQVPDRGCARQMERYVEGPTGGKAALLLINSDDRPPNIYTFRGGQDAEPKWLDPEPIEVA